MTTHVFFSWQSDIKGAACRTLIQQALEGAAAKIGRDSSLGIEPVIDRDTQNVPGCPDIGAAIFGKIDVAAAFVADVTLITPPGAARPAPNPNVLVELGYALRALGEKRILLVQNTAFGGPELLPFDLRQKRVMTYESLSDAQERAKDRRALEEKLQTALRHMLKEPTTATADIAVRLEHVVKSRSQKLHNYELIATITNTSNRRIDDWQLEIEFPTALVDSVIYAAKVDRQSNAERSLFRTGRDSLKQPLQFGEARDLRIGYHVDDAIWKRRNELFGKAAVVRGFVDGMLVASAERRIEALQEY